MAKNFTSTLEKMFITNPSFLFSSVWSVIKSKLLNFMIEKYLKYYLNMITIYRSYSP